MVNITFETHSTTVDNENEVCFGHFDAKLSKTGRAQAKELGVRRSHDDFADIFCSDLSRSTDTAEIAFGKRLPVIVDSRLHECDFGDFTHCTREIMDEEQFKRITEPFPNGESYAQAFQHMGEFLNDLFRDYDGQHVLIIGHGATRFALDYWLNGLSAKDAILATKTWQPGWDYVLVRSCEMV